MLVMFDFPDPNAHSASRSSTTTPLQKLFVLNSPFMVRQAEAFADRLLKEIEGDTDQDAERRIQRAYGLAFGRSASPTETRLARVFLRGTGEDIRSAWHQYAQVLLASNETLFID